MDKLPNKKILVVDDDPEISKVFELYLKSAGYITGTLNNGAKTMDRARVFKPDLIFLDIMMPELDGFEICSRLKREPDLAQIPVVFVTVFRRGQDKVKAYATGGSDYLNKPVEKKDLLAMVEKHVTGRRKMPASVNVRQGDARKEKPRTGVAHGERVKIDSFADFISFLLKHIHVSPSQAGVLDTCRKLEDIYKHTADLEISSAQLAQYVSEFFKIPYIVYIDPETIVLGVFTPAFCRRHLVVPIEAGTAWRVFVISNPFDLVLLDTVSKTGDYALMVTEPENIEQLFAASGKATGKSADETLNIISQVADAETDRDSARYVANNIISRAISQRASDIHLEPKEKETVVRLRIDGDLQAVFSLKPHSSQMLISMLKVQAGLDIAERRKPQDGSFAIKFNNRVYKLRVATTFAHFGESVVIRLLQPKSRPKELKELGMTEEQYKIILGFASQTSGLILVVGPTGSGKTTTIYSLLSQVDCRTRSLISVEDPVEYNIPDANQQQVNEKSGATFEMLLKSALRQDPNILFIGEIRDRYSASVALELASTGHLTITSLHTSNTTTSVFRLETLGLSRAQMSDSILGIAAQKLLKLLCPYCKNIEPINEKELNLLKGYTTDPPKQVARPVGCAKCNQTGYFGREAVYEILKFDAEIAELVRNNVPIPQMRMFLKKRGDFLITDHALEKVRSLKMSVRQVYENVLLEDYPDEIQSQSPSGSVSAEETLTESVLGAKSILVVEDDLDTRNFIVKILENRGYTVTAANDGVDALLLMVNRQFDLILSDVNMPNLDGFKLIEIKTDKGITTPIIFITSSQSLEDEQIGLTKGAVDYIKKPFSKETLVMRIQRFIGVSGGEKK